MENGKKNLLISSDQISPDNKYLMEIISSFKKHLEEHKQ